MQCYSTGFYFRSSLSVNDSWKKYKKIAPNAYLHTVDLSGYGTSQVAINDHNVALYSGWNTKFLDLIAQVERGIGSLIQDIENYR